MLCNSIVVPKRTSSLIIYHNYKTKSFNSRSSVYSCVYIEQDNVNDDIDNIINMYF